MGAAEMNYSQDGEEAIILKHFAGKREGRLLDIGAADGERFSNTRTLMESFNWSGAFFEPCARSFARLVELYHDSDKAILYNIALAPDYQGGVREMQYALDTVVSTFDKKTHEAWKDSGRYCKVRVSTLAPQALFSHGFGFGFDFISIDAEGWSFSIAERMLTLAKPSLWCIENDEGFQEFEKLMNANGYKQIATTQANTLWALK